MTAITLAPGLVYHPDYLDRSAQEQLLDELRAVITRRAALHSAHAAHRQAVLGAHDQLRAAGMGLGHGRLSLPARRIPETGEPWPAIPGLALRAWEDLSGFPHAPDACLINFYDPGARMGMHQDKDEEDFAAPVVSLSLGQTGLFRYGGLDRKDPTRSVKLRSGDAIVFGGPARLIYHGIDRLIPGPSDLLPQGGRLNLTLRKVTKST